MGEREQKNITKGGISEVVKTGKLLIFKCLIDEATIFAPCVLKMLLAFKWIGCQLSNSGKVCEISG